jgi:hypothetical protein
MHRFSRLFVGPLAVVLFVGVLAATPTFASDPLLVEGLQVRDTGSNDIVVDVPRGLIYAAVRPNDEIVSVDLDSGRIQARYPISAPSGMSLSADGTYLYVSMYSSPGLARIDLSDWSKTLVDPTGLGTDSVSAVLEISPDVVFVSVATTAPADSGNYVYNFNTGIGEPKTTYGYGKSRAKLAMDGNNSIFLGSGSAGIYRLDASSPEYVIGASNIWDADGAGSFALSPNGAVVALADGKKLRSDTLKPTGNIERGIPLFNDDGSLLYTLYNEWYGNVAVAVSDPASGQVLQRWTTTCRGARVSVTSQFVKGFGSAMLVAGTDDSLCIIDTDTVRTAPRDGGRFFDDDASIHQKAIDAIATAGITRGCNPPYQSAYCPDEPLTRAQMAAFLVRALGLSDTGGGNSFIDDDASIYETDIARLAASGITRGCNPPENTKFCPDDIVTRGQMAAFLVRAMGYKRTVINVFDDDNGSVFEPDIDALASAGVTLGCNPPWNFAFCPDQPVTRAQMATFLARALKLIQDDIPERPPTTDGFNLDVRDKAADAGCTRANGEICEITQTVTGEFYLHTGVVEGNWYYLTEAQQIDFRSDKVRIDVTFDGKPLDLITIPFISQGASGYKYWTFQFPAWLDGTHVLEIQYIDETTNYVWIIRDTLITTGPGYDHETPL